MPIKIPTGLASQTVLLEEGVMVMTEEAAIRQDIRPLQIALVNLMPTAIRTETETQFARLLGATPLQIELTLLRMATHHPKSQAPDNVLSAYRVPEEVCDQRFDGMVVTGAPVERLSFEEVYYWPELTRLFAWADTHVHSVVGICWGAQAMLYHWHGVPKHMLPAKMFGCYRHQSRSRTSPYLRGLADNFLIPVSRHTEVRESDLVSGSGINVLASSDEAGLCLLEEPGRRALYMFNHIEYDTDSLAREYRRDAARGLPIDLPVNYFPQDDPARPPANRWRSQAHLLLGNWINEVYQSTPFNIDRIGREA